MFIQVANPDSCLTSLRLRPHKPKVKLWHIPNNLSPRSQPSYHSHFQYDDNFSLRLVHLLQLYNTWMADRLSHDVNLDDDFFSTANSAPSFPQKLCGVDASSPLISTFLNNSEFTPVQTKIQYSTSRYDNRRGFNPHSFCRFANLPSSGPIS